MCFTRRKRREFKLALQGKMTSGKLKATENTKKSLITSDEGLGSKLIKMFPIMKKRLSKIEFNN